MHVIHLVLSKSEKRTFLSICDNRWQADTEFMLNTDFIESTGQDWGGWRAGSSSVSSCWRPTCPACPDHLEGNFKMTHIDAQQLIDQRSQTFMILRAIWGYGVIKRALLDKKFLNNKVTQFTFNNNNTNNEYDKKYILYLFMGALILFLNISEISITNTTQITHSLN